MNPWLEQKWSDVHLSLISFIRQDFGAELPDGLVARAEDHIVVTDNEGAAKNYRSDLSIRTHQDSAESWKSGHSPLWSETESAEGDLRVAVPKLVMSEDEPPHRWIEISAHDGRLVTVIEILSPANKEGKEAVKYCGKRADYLAGGVSVVEIDLLRGGQHTVNVLSGEVDDPGTTPYLICVTRGSMPWRQELYECAVRKRLPIISIPLRLDDPDLPLDIQSLVDRTYETGRYWTLDYSRKLSPRLSDSDAEWAREQLLAAELLG